MCDKLPKNYNVNNFQFSPYSPLNLKSGQVKFGLDKSKIPIFAFHDKWQKKLTSNSVEIENTFDFISRITTLLKL